MVYDEEDNIVCTWLRFLHVEEYSKRFLDNGYDDLETVKQIKEEDLKAIGIESKEDEEIILLSVKILRERGAAWVYFLCEDDQTDFLDHQDHHHLDHHDYQSISQSETSQKMSSSDDDRKK